MRDLSLHLLDILENAVRAGAGRVDITLHATAGQLMLRIADNGPGFPPSVRGDPTDPFRTTRRERRIGLGLSLLRQSAEAAGGTLQIDAPPGGGVTLTCRYDPRHIDARPPGDMTGALMTALLAWPETHIVLWGGTGTEPLLDSALLRETLDGIPLEHPRIQQALRETLDKRFRDLLGSVSSWSSKRSVPKQGARHERS